MDFYKSLKNTVRNVLAGAMLVASLGAQAQAVWDVSDGPLLGGDNQVKPNLMFMFDDSGSMTSFYGGQYPYCMDAYNLSARFYGQTETYPYKDVNWKSWLWRNCSLYGDNMKTPFDFDIAYPYYADPKRLSGPNRDLRTLATFSSTFNPLYYNPDVRYVPWPGMPDSDPKAARPLATNPDAPATSTFNLINNANLYLDRMGGIYYLDEKGQRVYFSEEFAWNFKTNTVVEPYIRDGNTSGYDTTFLNVIDVFKTGYTDTSPLPNGAAKPVDACFTYDNARKVFKPKFTIGNIEIVKRVNDGAYNIYGGIFHDAFDIQQDTLVSGAQPVCTGDGYKVYRANQVLTTFYPPAGTTERFNFTPGAFFIAQYVKFIGNPLLDTDVLNMDNYITVKIDKSETAIPLGNTSYPPGTAVKSANRTDCTEDSKKLKCSLREEQINFANWFTYYKTKRGMAIGTVAQAFERLPGGFRVGWGQLSKGNSLVDTVNSEYIVQGVRRWDETNQLKIGGPIQTTGQHFRDWIAKIGTAGTTTLREELEAVGKYFRRTDNAGPWGNSPGNPSDNTAQLTCRRNYHVTVTDGAWTGSGPGAGRGNVDGTNQGGNYIASRPYSDAWSNTLADISMYYWANDLRPDMADTVNGTPNDPANWQHLTNYYLMLNLSKTIDGDSAADMQALTNGTKSWPEPKSEAAKIDDTLHAALNSRGKLFHVTGPESVINAISSIQNDMSNSRGGSDAQVQVSGQYLTQTSKKFKPAYTTIPWGGNLEAINLNADGSDGATAWSASDRLRVNLPADRKIFTMSGSTVRAFSKNDLPSVNAGVNQSSADLQNLADYVRGDRSLEGQGYRIRASALGDIINSSPLLVGSGLDAQYDLSTGAGHSTYLTFLKAKKARPERIYVGANDGMLHTFNANTGDEDFAYIPSSLLSKFFNFASPTYSHRYFVDGQITELDAYDTTAAKWRNLVVTSTGAGAKTVFAINVPTGANAAAPGAADLLWEISDTSSDFSELGYTLGKLEAGLMRNGQYAVLINNGYASASGTASLFIVNALTGALIKKIDTGVGANTVANKNGLGGVRVIRNAAREIVAAYAGDLKGNMWKFDLLDTNSSKWNLAFTPQVAKKPLFKVSLPITAAPGLIAHPVKGLMVIFGTGKMFESSDPGTAERGYIYGVWDNDEVGKSALASSNNLADSSTLVEQTLTSTDVTQPDGSTKKTFYTASNNTVDYGINRGWYVRLAASERVIYDPQAALGRIYVESVVSRTATAGDAITCNPSSFNLNGYLLDPFTGSYNAARPTLDTNGDGVLNASDTTTVVGYKTPTISRASVIQSKVAGAKGVLVSANDQKAFNGNQALVRRAWRHIVTPP